MKYWHGIVMYMAALILQPFLYNLTPDLHVTANLILCLTIVLVFLYEDFSKGIILGTAFGLLSDIVFGIYIGPGAVSILITALIVVFLRYYANIENIFNILIMTVIATGIYMSSYWVIYHFAGSPYGYIYAMKSLPLHMLLNCIVVAVLYIIFIRKVVKFRRDRYFK